jgi:RNA recognition motif-containing protein
MQRTFFLGNLPYQTDEMMLRELFGPYGTVTAVNLVGDRVNGVFRGFGFLKIDTQDEKRITSELDNMPLGNQRLIVQELNSKDVTKQVAT